MTEGIPMIRYMIANFALLTAFIFLFHLVFRSYLREEHRTMAFRLLTGISHGLCALLLLLFSVQIEENTFVDFRQVIVISSAFFGGLPASLITAAFVVFGRIIMFGQITSSIVPIVVSIAITAIGSGLIMRYVNDYWRRWLYSLTLSVTMIVSISLIVKGFSKELAIYVMLVCLGGLFTAALISYFISTARLSKVLQQSELRYRSLHALQEAIFQSPTNTAIIVLDFGGSITHVNKAAAKMLGYSVNELIGASPLIFHDAAEIDAYSKTLPLKNGKPILGVDIFKHIAEENNPEGREWSYIRKDGIKLTVLLTVSPLMLDGLTLGVIGIATDISERKKMEERLKQLSLIDGLTGIANRRFFDETLQQEWNKAIIDELQKGLSLLLIDIDNFKAYNDIYGHQSGDDCLRQVTSIARKTVNHPASTIARYGGEEFALILPDLGSTQAMRIAEEVRAAIEQAAIPHGGSAVSSVVTISIGMATYDPTFHHTPEDLIGKTDEALYDSKTQGRNRVTEWHAELMHR